MSPNRVSAFKVGGFVRYENSPTEYDVIVGRDDVFGFFPSSHTSINNQPDYLMHRSRSTCARAKAPDGTMRRPFLVYWKERI